MDIARINFSSQSAEDTIQFAHKVATVLRAGDCLLLDGPVGAGKSLFSRAIIQHLQIEPEDVPSPTFTLVQTYETPVCEIWHCDLYRLTSVYEVAELGLIDAFEDCICLIEWPDRLGDLAPEGALRVSISDRGPQKRDINLEGPKTAWGDRLAGLASYA